MKPTFSLEAEAEKLSWPVDGYNYTKVIAENDAIDLARRYAEAQQADNNRLREALDSSNQTNAFLVKRLASTMTELVKLRAFAREYLDALQAFSNDGEIGNKVWFDKAEADFLKLLKTAPARTERAE
jgi:hypothetical protein